MNKIKEILKEQNENILFLKPHFDDALIGSGRACGKTTVAVYDSDKCLRILINKFKINELEELDKIQKIVVDVPHDSYKPIFITDFRNIKELPFLDIN